MAAKPDVPASAACRRFAVGREFDRWMVRVDATDRLHGERAPTAASAGTGMPRSGGVPTVLLIADEPATLREIGDAYIAAADLIERGACRSTACSR